MCKRNSPHKEASTGCVRETPYIRKPAQDVGLLCDSVSFLLFYFLWPFSLSSSSMLSVLFCLGCCRAPFSLPSAKFFTLFPKLTVTMLILLLFSLSLSLCLFVLFCLGCCRAPFSLLSAPFSCSFPGPSSTQPFYLVEVF